ncbi:MAG: hypothetical protein COC06_11270 [Bacteroidales bacterium]|nr:MAG: hypothetical protein COC06_11270 [Bacteroidales bacterium]
MDLELVKKYFQGECNRKEIEQAEQFLEECEEVDLFLKQVWDDVPNTISASQTTFSKNAIKTSIIQYQNKRRKTFYLKAKKSLLVAASIMFFLMLLNVVYIDRKNNTEYFIVNESSDNSIQNYQLEEGTNIWLQPNSSISYFGRFNKKDRNVYLVGEAYFDVTKDSLKPFKVITGEVTVTVLGTMFNIKAYDFEKKIQIILTEGSVKVTSDKGKKKPVIMTPGDLLNYDKTGNRFSLEKTNNVQKGIFTSNQFVFSNVSIEEALLRVANRYEVQIDFSSLTTKERLQQISGIISATSLKGAIQQIGFIHNIKFEEEGGVYVINKNKK